MGSRTCFIVVRLNFQSTYFIISLNPRGKSIFLGKRESAYLNRRSAQRVVSPSAQCGQKGWEKMKAIKPISAVVLSLVISQSALGGVQAGAKQGVDPVPEPPSGYFIDTYKNNVSGNKTASNPTIGVLSQYNRIWKPGQTWDSGVVLDQSVHEHNIQTVLDKTSSRTKAQADAAYLDDRGSQSYSALDGLGSLTDIYRRDANATTTITGIPQDALTKKYTDEGTGAGTTDSELGQMAGLVETLRGEYSSTSSAKDYYRTSVLSDGPIHPSSYRNCVRR